MTVKQSDLLANAATTTNAGTPNAPSNEHGRIRSANGNVALLTTDLDINDVVVLCALPTSAVVLSIKIANDDLDTGAGLVANVGLYSDATGLVVKDIDNYATLIVMQAAVPFTEYAFEARGIELNGQKVWQDAGDTVDPNSTYYLAVTFSTGAAVAAAGDLAFQVEYAVD